GARRAGAAGGGRGPARALGPARPRAGTGGRGRRRRRRRGGPWGGRVAAGGGADPEPPAEIGDASLPAQRLPSRGCERRQPLDRRRLRGEVRQLGADMDVQAEHAEPPLEGVLDRGEGLLGGKAQLRSVLTAAPPL